MYPVIVMLLLRRLLLVNIATVAGSPPPGPSTNNMFVGTQLAENKCALLLCMYEGPLVLIVQQAHCGTCYFQVNFKMLILIFPTLI